MSGNSGSHPTIQLEKVPQNHSETTLPHLLNEKHGENSPKLKDFGSFSMIKPVQTSVQIETLPSLPIEKHEENSLKSESFGSSSMIKPVQTSVQIETSLPSLPIEKHEENSLKSESFGSSSVIKPVQTSVQIETSLPSLPIEKHEEKSLKSEGFGSSSVIKPVQTSVQIETSLPSLLIETHEKNSPTSKDLGTEHMLTLCETRDLEGGCNTNQSCETDQDHNSEYAIASKRRKYYNTVNRSFLKNKILRNTFSDVRQLRSKDERVKTTNSLVTRGSSHKKLIRDARHSRQTSSNVSDARHSTQISSNDKIFESPEPSCSKTVRKNLGCGPSSNTTTKIAIKNKKFPDNLETKVRKRPLDDIAISVKAKKPRIVSLKPKKRSGDENSENHNFNNNELRSLTICSYSPGKTKKVLRQRSQNCTLRRVEIKNVKSKRMIQKSVKQRLRNMKVGGSVRKDSACTMLKIQKNAGPKQRQNKDKVIRNSVRENKSVTVKNKLKTGKRGRRRSLSKGSKQSTQSSPSTRLKGASKDSFSALGGKDFLENLSFEPDPRAGEPVVEVDCDSENLYDDGGFLVSEYGKPFKKKKKSKSSFSHSEKGMDASFILNERGLDVEENIPSLSQATLALSRAVATLERLGKRVKINISSQDSARSSSDIDADEGLEDKDMSWAEKLPLCPPNPSSEPVSVFHYVRKETPIFRCDKSHPCCQQQRVKKVNKSSQCSTIMQTGGLEGSVIYPGDKNKRGKTSWMYNTVPKLQGNADMNHSVRVQMNPNFPETLTLQLNESVNPKTTAESPSSCSSHMQYDIPESGCCSNSSRNTVNVISYFPSSYSFSRAEPKSLSPSEPLFRNDFSQSQDSPSFSPPQTPVPLQHNSSTRSIDSAGNSYIVKGSCMSSEKDPDSHTNQNITLQLQRILSSPTSARHHLSSPTTPQHLLLSPTTTTQHHQSSPTTPQRLLSPSSPSMTPLHQPVIQDSPQTSSPAVSISTSPQCLVPGSIIPQHCGSSLKLPEHVLTTSFSPEQLATPQNPQQPVSTSNSSQCFVLAATTLGRPLPTPVTPLVLLSNSIANNSNNNNDNSNNNDDNHNNDNNNNKSNDNDHSIHNETVTSTQSNPGSVLMKNIRFTPYSILRHPHSLVSIGRGNGSSATLVSRGLAPNSKLQPVLLRTNSAPVTSSLQQFIRPLERYVAPTSSTFQMVAPPASNLFKQRQASPCGGIGTETETKKTICANNNNILLVTTPGTESATKTANPVFLIPNMSVAASSTTTTTKNNSVECMTTTNSHPTTTHPIAPNNSIRPVLAVGAGQGGNPSLGCSPRMFLISLDSKKLLPVSCNFH